MVRITAFCTGYDELLTLIPGHACGITAVFTITCFHIGSIPVSDALLFIIYPVLTASCKYGNRYLILAVLHQIICALIPLCHGSHLQFGDCCLGIEILEIFIGIDI